VGDLLEISVYGVPELSQKVRVNSTGDIYLPLIDYLHVDKLTPEDTQAAIEKKLVDGGFVKNPHVTIMITESAGAGVSVLGEVARPGVYPVLGQRRLFDVISAAGGFTEKAGKAVTITHRNQPEQPVAIKLEAQLSEGPQNNVEISPGDTIVVARAGIFYVVGDVVRPSGFIIDSDNVSVLKAVALAGGPNRTAALGKVTLIRKTPQGFHQTSVPLKKILEAKAPDVLLQPEDILFIPVSRGKVLGTRTMEAAVQLATGVGIVAVTRF
jgi:polysaccharide export outer membrane protein